MKLAPGHNIYLLALHVDIGKTAGQVERRVIEWLGDALKLDPPGLREIRVPSDAGEYVVGPANPVTVIVELGTDAQVRQATFCRNEQDTDRQDITFAAPAAPVAPVVLHVDWAGVVTTLPDFWRLGALGWTPDADEPELVVRAQCQQPERVRDPIEPPSRLPSFPPIKLPNVTASDLLFWGAGLAAILGAVYIYAGRQRP